MAAIEYVWQIRTGSAERAVPWLAGDSKATTPADRAGHKKKKGMIWKT
jgi:hypothetical protein